MNTSTIERRTPREGTRLVDLDSYRILDTPVEQSFDDIVALAALTCAAPIALITLVAADREWFKARIGVPQTQLPRYLSMCSRAIETPDEVMIVPDLRQDPEFANNALVTGSPGVRFYAGAPLVTPLGSALGTVCVMDHVPRTLNPAQIGALQALARQVIAQLELRRMVQELAAAGKQLSRSHQALEARQDHLTEINARLHTAARQDSLTGVANRRAFDEQLEAAVDLATTRSEPLSLIMVDIDRFKTVNDTFGHQAGDDVLRSAGRRLQEVARKGDLVARYGGEEFAVVCPGISEKQACAVAERFRSAIAEVRCDGRAITASAGVASLSVEALSAGELVAGADRALYHAKQTGRDKVVGRSLVASVGAV